MVGQWLRLGAFRMQMSGFRPGWGASSHALQHGPEKY